MNRKKGLAKIIAFALTLCMVMSMSPVVTFASQNDLQNSAGGIEYLSPVYKEAGNPESGLEKMESKICTDYKVLDENMTELTTGWYVLSSDIEVKRHSVRINGDVHLVLCDGKKYTGTKHSDRFIVNSGNSLSIYGQTEGTGELSLKEGSDFIATAAIGSEKDNNSGRIEINGGVLNLKGSYASAAIGGGKNGVGQDIIINGGKVTATSRYGAGIGGGRGAAGKNIIINGGTVNAEEKNDSQSIFDSDIGGAGIGGGDKGEGSYIFINGGEVNAAGLRGGAGIGGGEHGFGHHIVISGGTVTANGDLSGAGIGGGEDRTGSDIEINGAVVNATGGNEGGAGIGGGDGGDGENITITNSTVTAKGENSSTSIGGGAGIGGGTHAKGRNITIKDCPNVEVCGDIDGAGIGGGEDGDGENIKIINSHVTATGGKAGGAGIGGGKDADGFNIIIEGEDTVVEATGGSGGAGIGGGKGRDLRGLDKSKNHDIDEFPLIIKGGTVTAKGGDNAAGIGGGSGGTNTSHLMICGGNVRAYGSRNAAGIGGGKGGECWEIYVTGKDTNVYAQGGVNGGAGIGGARDRTGANIHIGEGARVTARSFGDNPNSSGIGGGSDGDTFSIYIYKDSVAKADNSYPPETVIPNDGGNVAGYTHTRKNVTVVPEGDEDPIDCLTDHDGSYEGFIAAGASSKTADTITWNEVEGAEGYEVYYAKKGKSLKLAGTTTDLKFTKKGLGSKYVYRFKVKAFCNVEDQKEYIDTTPVIYVTGTKTKYSNATKVSAVPMAMQMETGDTGKLKVKISKKSSKKAAYGKSKITYVSTDSHVASVSSKGKVKAKNEGIAYIYAYAASGAFAKITVVVE